MLYMSETVAMVMFVLLPALVLAGLFLPERKFNKKMFKHNVFRIETDPEKKAALEEKADRLLVHAYAD